MQHNPTKIALSKYELELVTNAQILLTKNDIIKKIYELFGLLADAFVPETKTVLPEEVTSIPAKISRGENYEGLPYVMLDYPRYFKKEDTFAIRTFFWWGNFFSITMQLAGKYQELYSSKLQKAIQEGKFNEWYISAGESEWDHHYRASNYRFITSETTINDRAFLKLSTKIPLEKWDQVQYYLQEKFSTIIEVLER